jgi:hypothetical protein
MKKAIGLAVVVLMFSSMVAAQTLSLPAGTAVKMKLETRISTQTTKVGDNFAGRVTEPVMIENRVVIPVGAAIEGHVAKISEPRRVKGRPEIDLRPDTLTMPDGNKFNISAVVVDTDKNSGTSVNDEGKIKGPGATSSDKKEILIGTGAGLGVGAIADGGKGAVVGAMIGASVTVAHWLTKHHSAELPAGSEITMELSRPMAMSGAGR